jgi:phosphoribosylformimino-5-aminoimidazole carboxamide ribotide isomerase
MLLIPAIDLKDGKCVRLKQGDMNDSTTFGEDPAAMARRWVDAGARRLHLVDLNGAFAGKPVNESAIKAILAEVGDEIPVQLGGGIRDLDTIERYLDDGLSYVIIGTAAVKNPGFLRCVQRLRRSHHRRARCEGRQGGDRRVEQADGPRGRRSGEEVRGLRRRRP